MYEFNYQRPASLADAVAVLTSDEEATALAGGMTLIPSMKHRLSAPSQLLDIAALPELQGIELSGDYLVVGAAMSHASVADSDVVAKAIPALSSLASEIGDPQVRARGTLGGSIANNDPAADYPAAVLGLDAVIRTNQREIAADDFFQGMFETALQPGELITQVAFKVPASAAYAKFHHPASGYAMTGVMIAKYQDTVRVAATGAAPCVHRWGAAEDALSKQFSVAAVESLVVNPDGLNADMHAPAEYRAHLVSVMTQRAIATCGA
jgi:carbon-monoxide dehydrogenase medium subunit